MTTAILLTLGGLGIWNLIDLIIIAVGNFSREAVALWERRGRIFVNRSDRSGLARAYLAEAQRRAGIDPRGIGYIECHGTGTRAGSACRSGCDRRA